MKMAAAKKATATAEVKETKKVTAKKATATKAVAEKAVEVKETKKAPAKKATTAKKEEVTVEFAGKAYTTEQLVQIAKDVWKYDLGRKATEFKTVKIYVKPEENQAYYVVNDEVTGSFSL
jgi:hypothetical protein